MIPVDRTSVPVPSDLDGPNSRGVKETEKAIEFYGKPVNRGKSFPFEAYGLPTVKSGLDALFHGKCAYCEARYDRTAPVDVEHYRPKGGVLVGDKLRKPGYYWLAARWDNLLPSCIDCNRARTHEFSDRKGKAGKANQFPLAGGAAPKMEPGAEASEKALLLDPTRDPPQDHLEFVANGTVRPRLTAAGGESERGSATIGVCALLRPRLCQARSEAARRVRLQVERVLRQTRYVVQYPADPQFKRDLAQEDDELRRMTNPDQEFAALARQIVATELG